MDQTLNQLRRFTATVFLLFFSALLFSQNADSVDSERADVLISLKLDRADAIYRLGEKARFSVGVKKKGSLLKNISISYSIGPEKMEPVKRETLVLKNGTAVIDGTMNKSGFLRCIITATVDGKTYREMATAGFEPEKISPTAVMPEDFLAFWNRGKAEASKVPLDAKMTLVAEQSGGDVNVFKVSFQNNQSNSRIYGVLCVPKKPGKYPAYIRFPGAGVRGYSGNSSFASKGFITLDIGIHGIPVDLNKDVYSGLLRGALFGYPLFNLEDRDSYYFKRVILGCLKSVDFIFSLPEFDGSNLAVMGSSQGGALSIITTALDPRIKYLVALCPALSDVTGYLHERAGGWPHMFSPANISKHGSPEKIKTSAYYDVVNFARLIKVPGYYSWGFNDETTPPTSIYSAFNSIQAPKELFTIPAGVHKIYPEQMARLTDWVITKVSK